MDVQKYGIQGTDGRVIGWVFFFFLFGFYYEEEGIYLHCHQMNGMIFLCTRSIPPLFLHLSLRVVAASRRTSAVSDETRLPPSSITNTMLDSSDYEK